MRGTISNYILLKRPLHVKLMLANSCWQTQIGVCERHNMLQNCWRQIELFFISPTYSQRFANTLLCRSHTQVWVCQHKLANISLTCEDRLSQACDRRGVTSHQEANTTHATSWLWWRLNFYYRLRRSVTLKSSLQSAHGLSTQSRHLDQRHDKVCKNLRECSFDLGMDWIWPLFKGYWFKVHPKRVGQ